MMTPVLTALLLAPALAEDPPAEPAVAEVKPVQAMPLDDAVMLYTKLLGTYVGRGGVDYHGLGADGLTPVLASFAQVDLAELNALQRKALYLNAYNALTLDLIADNLPLDSSMGLDGGKVWDTRTFTVAGEALTLSDIENKKLRTLGDPRIHAALNCASKGCPPLINRAFTADGLELQLDQAARAWVKTNAVKVDQANKVVHLSRIFEWYGEDFTAAWGKRLRDIPGVEGTQEAALNFVIHYSGPSEQVFLQAGGYKVVYAEYDWGLNIKP